MAVLMLARVFLRRPGLGMATAASVLATLATLLGTAALVAVMAAMDGFRADLSARMLGTTPHLSIEAPGGPDVAVALADALAALPGVQSARPGASVAGLLRGPVAAVGARLVGDPAIADDEIALPLPLARRLGTPSGAEVRLLVARLGPGTALSAEDIALAVFQINDTPAAGAAIARIGLGLASDLAPNGRARAEAILNDPTTDRAVARALAGRLPEGAVVRTWRDENSALLAALAIERTAMGLILGIVLLVAAVNTAAASAMLAQQKRRAIATLRALGATRSQVLSAMTLAGGGPAALGAAAGAAIGLLLAHHPETVSHVLTALAGEGGMTAPLPFRPSFSAAAAAALLGLAAALPAALLPAWNAATADPIAAFRR
jgi:lipoprotein-releasing system permease protein